jgi:hypothetical protein
MDSIKLRRRVMPVPPPEYVYAAPTESGQWAVSSPGSPIFLLSARELLEQFAPLAPSAALEAAARAEDEKAAAEAHVLSNRQL